MTGIDIYLKDRQNYHHDIGIGIVGIPCLSPPHHPTPNSVPRPPDHKCALRDMLNPSSQRPLLDSDRETLKYAPKPSRLITCSTRLTSDLG
jgi:hypothetical protein